MTKALFENLKFMFKRLSLTFSSIKKNKKSFFTQTIFMLVNNLFFLFFWYLVFSVNDGQIRGLNFKNILYLWAIPSLSWGMVRFVFGGIFKINQYIKNGSFESFLLQPKSIFLNIALSDCYYGGAGDIIYGLVLAIFAAPNVCEYSIFLLSSFLAIIFMICSISMVRFSAIWLKEVEEISQTYEYNFLMNFSTHPEQIFDVVIKTMMFTVVPAMYITHLPIRLLSSFDVKIFGIILLALAAYVATTILVFKAGIRHYGR